jgi:hypothetical protein
MIEPLAMPALRWSRRPSLEWSAVLVAIASLGCGSSATTKAVATRPPAPIEPAPIETPPPDEPLSNMLDARCRGSDRPASLAVSDDGGCVVSDDGRVYCWNLERDASSATAERVPNLGDAFTVARGHGFGCAVTRDYVPRCWDTAEPGASAMPEELTNVERIAAYGADWCALQPNGVWCSEGLPIRLDLYEGGLVRTGRDVCATFALSAICVDLESGGPTHGFGGCRSRQPRLTDDFLACALAMSAESTCVLSETGSVSCFGDAAVWGLEDRIEDEDYESEEGVVDERENDACFPSDVGWHARSHAIANHIGCLVGNDGELACWGDSSVSETGYASAVEDRVAADEVAAFGSVVCARLRDGGVRCWRPPPDTTTLRASDRIAVCVDRTEPCVPVPTGRQPRVPPRPEGPPDEP